MPLVVIVMTWPTFARIFDSQDFWVHTSHWDYWLRIWDAWHLERVLSGQAELFHTESMFHPAGISLVWKHFSLPHTILLLVLKKLMPVNSAYNLLFLLILQFNAFSAYVLLVHLLNDKWIALYGALVVTVSIPFVDGSTTLDLIMIGTIPITLYFFLRHVKENRRLFAALAGFCAGVTAFIGVYTFVFILITIGIIAVFLTVSHWKRPAFWRGLLLFIVVCGLVSSLRFYPILVDAAVLNEGLHAHLDQAKSNDVLQCCVVTGNPFTGDLFRNVFAFGSASTADRLLRLGSNSAYLGYINLLLVMWAILHKPLRRRLAPWLTVLVFFAILRLGHFLTIIGQEYNNILLPEHFLREWLPALFGSIHDADYYQFGVVVPLAILASFGLARLTRSKPASVRSTIILLSVLILAMEYYAPLSGGVIQRERTDYNDWLSTESDRAIKLVNLPQKSTDYGRYFQGMQTFNGYPTAFGTTNRIPISAMNYIRGNALLQNWSGKRSVHCLPYNERSFLTALDKLLEDGFTHVVVHHWLYGDQFINYSFWNVPAAYADGFVSVYRLRDLRLSCEHLDSTLPRFDHFAASPAAIPGRRSSILSFHPSEAIDDDLFAYLASLFSDWRSLLHLHLDGGEPVIQGAGASSADLDSFARDNQVIYLLYNKRDTDAKALNAHISFDGFKLCQRDEHEDGSVIKQYLKREFSCSLVASSRPMQVDYDNGARLANASIEATRDMLEIQLMWSNLPSEPHAVSLQVFNAEGDKVLGQDSTIADAALARQHIDISSLPPGNYVVKLIVYDFNTRVSVPGTVSAESLRFERELEIASVDRT